MNSSRKAIQLKFYFPAANCPAWRLPIHGDLDGDGRSGFQVLTSAITYLDFCSGRAWRPASHRYHPTVEYFVDGIRVLSPLRAAFAQSRHREVDVRSARACGGFVSRDLVAGELITPRDLVAGVGTSIPKKPSQSIGFLPQAKKAAKA